ncbi:MAG TPA: hypothetical protein VGD40_11860 [Chryseosolibacter sp.]
MHHEKQIIAPRLTSLASLIFVFSCSDVNDLTIIAPAEVKTNNTAHLTIVRTGTGSGEWDVRDKDGFNYYFSSLTDGAFQVEVSTGKENDYCQSSESNEVSDGKMRNEVRRDMLIKEKSAGEITIAIACHKPIYRFTAVDSVVSVRMIIEDADEKVRDTVVFKIVR